MRPLAFMLTVSLRAYDEMVVDLDLQRASAFSMSRVRSMSAREGVGSPLGWL